MESTVEDGGEEPFSLLEDLDMEVATTSIGGSSPGHRVSGTQSKVPNLNENGQKSHFFARFF